jgi:hypothetical protein
MELQITTPVLELAKAVKGSENCDNEEALKNRTIVRRNKVVSHVETDSPDIFWSCKTFFTGPSLLM